MAKPSKGVLPNVWSFSYSSLFDQSLKDNIRVFPDLPAKIAKFIETKKDNPLSARFGKHDSIMTGPLGRLWHCHLRDDAVLIYALRGRTIHLIVVVSHSDIEGKRLKATATRLRNAGEMPEGLADRIIAGMERLLG